MKIAEAVKNDHHYLEEGVLGIRSCRRELGWPLLRKNRVSRFQVNCLRMSERSEEEKEEKGTFAASLHSHPLSASFPPKNLDSWTESQQIPVRWSCLKFLGPAEVVCTPAGRCEGVEGKFGVGCWWTHQGETRRHCCWSSQGRWQQRMSSQTGTLWISPSGPERIL